MLRDLDDPAHRIAMTCITKATGRRKENSRYCSEAIIRTTNAKCVSVMLAAGDLNRVG